MRSFVAERHFEIKGRGRLWCGPCPFRWNKDDGLAAWEGRWSIEHPDLDPSVPYKVTAVESYALQIIRKGAEVGLLIEPVD